MKGRVLIIAGSDCSGGAGIQADVKTVTALGGYAMTAITALTAQNTQGVAAIHEVPCEFISKQIQMCLSDIGADCAKTGMLHSADVIVATAAALDKGLPLVVDPVMVAKGGQVLLQPQAVVALKAELIPRAHVLTPNIPEAEVLTGLKITDKDTAHQALEKLSTLGANAVLLKGGHLPGDTVVDLLSWQGQVDVFESPWIDSRHTHGTGCTLASAIAIGLAQGMNVREAIVRARDYVQEAIRTAPGFGQGHGPLNHTHTVQDF